MGNVSQESNSEEQLWFQPWLHIRINWSTLNQLMPGPHPRLKSESLVLGQALGMFKKQGLIGVITL